MMLMVKIRTAQLEESREELTGNLVEHTYEIRVGRGQFDEIKIHRVFRERMPRVPARCPIGVMLLHGDSSDFDSAFMLSSMATFLAGSGIDVWGVDRRWTSVTPETLGDGSAMCAWNMTTHLHDLRIALNFARTVRLTTGSGGGRLFLCGHSSGANLCYAYANEDTKLVEVARNIKGIIPIDTVHKFDPAESQLIQDAEARYNAFVTIRDSGVCFSEDASTLKMIAMLAKQNPDGQSPIISTLNNKQVAILVLAATYATYSPPIAPVVPAYHFNAGIFDLKQLPTGLQLATLDQMIVFAEEVPPFQAINDLIDLEALLSNRINQYADKLGDVSIPVFYIAAAGGVGDYGQYTVNQIGSKDKTVKIMTIPDMPRELNYGHVDLLFAINAREEVWEPIAQWLKARA
jgi:pimeloyl-ACP methyl ester carboxylesterase